MKKPIDVLLLSSIEGHASIAEALAEGLRSHELSSEISVYSDPVFHLYRPAYRFFPWINKVFFQMSAINGPRQLISRYLASNHQKVFYDSLRQFEPKIIVTTYCGYDFCIEKSGIFQRIPYISMITDPRDFVSYNLSRCATFNCVFDHHQAELCQQYDPSVNIRVVGWLVRQKYEEPYNQRQVRKQLGLDPKQLTFLIVSGSEGSNVISSIFPSFFSITTPIQIVVACGMNTALFKNVEKFAQLLKKTKSQVKLIPLGFTSELHLYMQAADLVIGKAGPNSLFEAVATHTPFFAITHISGQENGNLDIIREYNLGYVEENPFKATKLIKHIIDHPEELRQFKEPLQKLAAYNHQAKLNLIHEIQQLTTIV